MKGVDSLLRLSKTPQTRLAGVATTFGHGATFSEAREARGRLPGMADQDISSFLKQAPKTLFIFDLNNFNFCMRSSRRSTSKREFDEVQNIRESLLQRKTQKRSFQGEGARLSQDIKDRKKERVINDLIDQVNGLIGKLDAEEKNEKRKQKLTRSRSRKYSIEEEDALMFKKGYKIRKEQSTQNSSLKSGDKLSFQQSEKIDIPTGRRPPKIGRESKKIDFDENKFEKMMNQYEKIVENSSQKKRLENRSKNLPLNSKNDNIPKVESIGQPVTEKKYQTFGVEPKQAKTPSDRKNNEIDEEIALFKTMEFRNRLTFLNENRSEQPVLFISLFLRTVSQFSREEEIVGSESCKKLVKELEKYANQGDQICGILQKVKSGNGSESLIQPLFVSVRLDIENIVFLIDQEINPSTKIDKKLRIQEEQTSSLFLKTTDKKLTPITNEEGVNEKKPEECNIISKEPVSQNTSITTSHILNDTHSYQINKVESLHVADYKSVEVEGESTSPFQRFNNQNYRRLVQRKKEPIWTQKFGCRIFSMIAVPSSSSQILIGYQDGGISLFSCDDKDGLTLVKNMRQNQSPVSSLALQHNSNQRGELFLASAYAGSDNSIVIWSFPELKPKKELIGHKGIISSLLPLKHNYLVSCSFDTTLILWDLDKSRAAYCLDCHQSPILSSAYIEESDIVICGALDFQICLCALDFSDGKLEGFRVLKTLRGVGSIMDICSLSVDRFLTFENAKIQVYDTRGVLYHEHELRILPNTFVNVNDKVGLIIDANGIPYSVQIESLFSSKRLDLEALSDDYSRSDIQSSAELLANRLNGCFVKPVLDQQLKKIITSNLRNETLKLFQIQLTNQVSKQVNSIILRKNEGYRLERIPQRKIAQ